ncbi:peroxisomal membrane 2 [Pelobates cultripes]|uniref:Peroxisomal membrane 2 n=1 Tax=Pelobates cultripes TaxID=61616 RepID=A0AAD1SQT4_PELCU|nr:peroxisomal membrane 2 [Pelobates cultripes]
MTVASKVVSERRAEPLPALLLRTYLRLLRERPIVTKSVTSGILSALGNLLSQSIERRRKRQKSSKEVDLVGPLRFAVYGKKMNQNGTGRQVSNKSFEENQGNRYVNRIVQIQQPKTGSVVGSIVPDQVTYFGLGEHAGRVSETPNTR